MTSKHFIGIHGYMLVYSVSSKQSFEMIRTVRDKLLNHLVSPFLGRAHTHVVGTNGRLLRRVLSGFPLSLSATRAIFVLSSVRLPPRTARNFPRSYSVPGPRRVLAITRTSPRPLSNSLLRSRRPRIPMSLILATSALSCEGTNRGQARRDETMIGRNGTTRTLSIFAGISGRNYWFCNDTAGVGSQSMSAWSAGWTWKRECLAWRILDHFGRRSWGPNRHNSDSSGPQESGSSQCVTRGPPLLSLSLFEIF